MKAIVTGATGFLGSALCQRLLQESWRVVGLGRREALAEDLKGQGLGFFKRDLAFADDLDAICQDADVVFHCAALSDLWGAYEAFYRANVLVTRRVAEVCRRAGVKRLVYVSSPSIYASLQDRFDVKEDAPHAPSLNHYIETKKLAEAALLDYRDELDIITLRPRGIFGEGDTSLLPRILLRLEQGRLPIIGDGNNIVDLTYVDNVVDALLLAARASDSHRSKAYNVTNGEAIELWELISELAVRFGHKQPSRRIAFRRALHLAGLLEAGHKLFRPRQEPLLTRYGVSLLGLSTTLDISSIKEDLGYQASVSLREGLERTMSHWEGRRHAEL